MVALPSSFTSVYPLKPIHNTCGLIPKTLRGLPHLQDIRDQEANHQELYGHWFRGILSPPSVRTMSLYIKLFVLFIQRVHDSFSPAGTPLLLPLTSYLQMKGPFGIPVMAHLTIGLFRAHCWRQTEANAAQCISHLSGPHGYRVPVTSRTGPWDKIGLVYGYGLRVPSASTHSSSYHP